MIYLYRDFILQFLEVGGIFMWFNESSEEIVKTLSSDIINGLSSEDS